MFGTEKSKPMKLLFAFVFNELHGDELHAVVTQHVRMTFRWFTVPPTGVSLLSQQLFAEAFHQALDESRSKIQTETKHQVMLQSHSITVIP